MTRNELNLLVKISILIATAIAIGTLLITGTTFTALVFLRFLSYGLACTTLFWWWYLNKAWKYWMLKKIFPRPNLDGTWYGTLHSDWKDDSGSTVEKQLFLVIRQNFLKIHVTSFTDKFIGSSYTESIITHNDFPIYKLVYVYGKETSDSGLQAHDQGVSELRIINSDKKMNGVYWTNIETKGTINLTKISTEHIDTYEDGLTLLNKIRA